MKKSVHADNAVDELIELIKEDGRWFEQEVLEYAEQLEIKTIEKQLIISK